MTPNLERILAAFRQHRVGVLLVLLVFFLLLRTWEGSVALFWGTLALSVVLHLEARWMFLAALATLAVTPLLYLVDRPAHAERAGVLAFSLIALGVLANLWDTLRARRLSPPTKPTTRAQSASLLSRDAD